MEDDPSLADPDRFALAAVQQYLHEHGHARALEALEQETGLRVRDEAPRGSQLLQLVYDHVERQLAAAADSGAAQRRRLEEALLAGGTAAGPGACPSVLRTSIEGLHAANICALACWPARRLAVTGSSDGSVAVLGYDGTLHRTVAAASSGILCLALLQGGHDSSSSAQGCDGGSMLVAAGAMDGSIVLLDGGSGAVLARAQPHRKYVVALRWAPDGRHLVSASWDQSFAVHRLRRPPACSAAAAAAAAADVAGAAGAAAGAAEGSKGSWELECNVYAEQTPTRVNALEFLPTPSSGGSDSSAGGGPSSSSFLVAVQGSNYLRQLSITSSGGTSSGGSGSGHEPSLPAAAEPAAAAGGAVVREQRRINLNAVEGDDHISFSAAHLALSPCGRLLLVSADNGRLVVYETAGWTQMRTLIGLPVDQFHQYAATWHRSGHYAMAAASHGALCIFHIGSARRVALLRAHSKTLRALCYDPQANLLLTASFDRSVKVWEAAAGPDEDRSAVAGA